MNAFNYYKVPRMREMELTVSGSNIYVVYKNMGIIATLLSKDREYMCGYSQICSEHVLESFQWKRYPILQNF